jgi:hypothetical protein
MALDCRIIRDDNGNLKKVEAPNGGKSILFDKLKNFFGEKKALELYALTETEAFKNLMSYKRGVFLNEQKEKLDQIATDLSNIDNSVQIAIQRNNGNPLNLAPNGKPSILYQSYKDLGYSEQEAERLVAQTYSDEFINNFFGDWLNNPENASKVVDENGQPRLVFHGTNNTFTEFSKDLLGSKNWLAESAYMGFFFAGSQETSKAYTGFNMFEINLKYPNLIKEVEETLPDTQIKEKIKINQEKQNKYVVERLAKTKEDLLKSGIDNNTANFLTKMYNSSFYDQYSKESFEKIKDESIKQDSEKLQKDRNDLLLKLYKERVNSNFNPNILNIFLNIRKPYVFNFKDSEERGLPYHIQQAKEQQNDGVIFENLKDGAEEDSIYVAFEPNQIKSATENVGTFSAQNNDIRFSVGEEKTAGEINQELIDKLKQNGLSEDVFLMSTQEIDAKLKELGVSDNIRKQVIAYHGSPYSFERFTTEKMGTGEGAQAFGWGLYFTDLESIAKNYANNENLIEKHLNSVYEFGVPDRFYQIPESARNAKESLITYIDNQIKGFNGVPYQQKEWQRLKDAVQSYKPNLYKVSLHKGKTPSEYTWLEWDKRPSLDTIEQFIDYVSDNIATSKSTKDNLQSKKEDVFAGRTKIETGQGFYQGFAKSVMQVVGKNTDKDISLALLEAGIDGIKYPAESISRGATSDTARGFNYVVFDENAITIEEQVQFQKALNQVGIDMIVNGFVYKNQVFLNKDVASNETAIHEFSHLFNSWLKENRKGLYNKGIDLVKAELEKENSDISDIISYVRTTQPDLKGEAFLEEVLAEITGKRGAELLNSKKKSGIIDWIREFWNEIKDMLGLLEATPEQVSKMTLKDFSDASAVQMLKGEKLPIVQVGGAKVFAKKQVNAVNDKPTGRIELDLITSENRGNGEAREAMKQFLQIMDANKQEVYLTVSPRDKQTSFDRLVKFYESFGFRLEPSGIEMVRRPKKVVPPTEDKNGEAKADEVIKFSKTTDEKLSKEELIEAMDSAVSLGVETSEELLENLDFNEYEQMKVDMSKVERLKAKLKNTPFSVPLIEVEKTSKVNSFGKQVPQVKQPTIPVQTVDENGNIVDKLSETKEVLQLTYPENKTDNLMPKLVGAIQKINNEIFNENSKLVYAVIEDIKEEALDFGVDLKDIENRIFPFQKLKDFLSALQEYTINPTAEFAKVYDQFFNVAPLMAYKPTFSSEFSEYELYDKFNLIRVGDTYQKVETPKLEPSVERQAKIAQLQVDDFRTDVVKLEEMVYHKEQLGQPLKTLPIEEVESVDLREVKKNPYLKVTAKGVDLINQDPLTLEKAMVYGYEPQVKETVEKIETDYSAIEDVLVTDLNNKSKVRTPLGVYTKIMDFQNKSIYTANLKNKTVNIKALLEKSDISPKIEAKKYYTKEEYDKNFSCL